MSTPSTSVRLPAILDRGTEPGDTGGRLLDDRAMERKHAFRRQTWRKWRLTGYGPPFIKIGNRVYYREADVDAWIDSHRYRSSAEVTVAREQAARGGL